MRKKTTKEPRFFTPKERVSFLKAVARAKRGTKEKVRKSYGVSAATMHYWRQVYAKELG